MGDEDMVIFVVGWCKVKSSVSVNIGERVGENGWMIV